MSTPISAYRGRLAPSPTGRLHVGNLMTFLLADARALQHASTLLLRIEDIDTARARPGASEAIVHDLAWAGIPWVPPDGSTGALQDLFQSTYRARHEAALAHLAERGLLYACQCSRRELRSIASAPHHAESVYPGRCRPPRLGGSGPDLPLDAPDVALRFAVRGTESFVDAVFGAFEADLEQDHGDFVVRRRDGLFAYHLAVVVDDARAGVTEVVRGADLLAAVPRQNHLHRALGHAPPATAHVPLLVDAHGERLSKRERALDVDGLCAAGWTPDTLRGAVAALVEQHPAPRLAHPRDLPLCRVSFAEAIEFQRLPRTPRALPAAFHEGPAAFCRAIQGAPVRNASEKIP
jgi:glutamyl-tRNA synthetase